MNQNRHIATQGRSADHIPGKQPRQAQAPGGFWDAFKNERGYQQNYAAFQSLQQQLERQQAAQAHFDQMQAQGQVQGPQHQSLAPMNWGGKPEQQRLRPRDFSSFGDMFDGGGAGQSGNTFQGGGLLSILGNLAGAKPRGQG